MSAEPRYSSRAPRFSARYRGLARHSLVYFGMILVRAGVLTCGVFDVKVIDVRGQGRQWPNEDD